jgi:ferric-dicitrate binding protein FerR (iron transport regulator)
MLTDGTVSVNNTPIEAAAMPFVLGEPAAVRTGQGRAAIALKGDGWLFLDASSSVRVLANADYNFNRVDVLSGSAIVSSATSTPLIECESATRTSSGGWFRFDAQPTNAAGERPCRVRVYEGAAAVPLVTVTNALRAGQSMICNRRCGDMIPTRDFSISELDAFDKWAQAALRLLSK